MATITSKTAGEKAGDKHEFSTYTGACICGQESRSGKMCPSSREQRYFERFVTGVLEGTARLHGGRFNYVKNLPLENMVRRLYTEIRAGSTLHRT